jgi:hypothetical protein
MRREVVLRIERQIGEFVVVGFAVNRLVSYERRLKITD